MRALVTGAAGFIGSHIVDHLIEAGHDVVATDDFSGGYGCNTNSRSEFIEGDLRDVVFVKELFNETAHFNIVYHCGAYAAEGLSHFIRRFNYDTNLLASVNLINESVLTGVKRFVFTSSIAVYGNLEPPFSEELRPAPEDPYGISKYAVELDLKAAARQFGLDYTIFRPHNVYGERQNISDPYRNVIGIFMSQVLKGEPMTIFGDGSQVRSFTHIDNVAPVIAEIDPLHRQSRNKTYNIGHNEKHSVLELAQIVADVAGVECNVTFLPARNEVHAAYSRHVKIREISVERLIPLKEGIERMFKWVNEVGIPEPTYFRGDIEVPINMPPSWKTVCNDVGR